jgi:chorismate mutase
MTLEEALRQLARHRDEVDAIDLQLLELLNSRTRVVEKIGRVKDEVGLSIYEPKREDAVFQNVTSHNTGPLSPDALKRIYERIIDEMRTLQRMRRENQAQKDKP